MTKSRSRRQSLFSRGSVCRRCGFVAVDVTQLTVDHIQPRWLGGPDKRHNFQLLCAPCHRDKNRIEGAARREMKIGQAARNAERLAAYKAYLREVWE